VGAGTRTVKVQRRGARNPLVWVEVEGAARGAPVLHVGSVSYLSRISDRRLALLLISSPRAPPPKRERAGCGPWLVNRPIIRDRL
jgi:hypothetical protein